MASTSTQPSESISRNGVSTLDQRQKFQAKSLADFASTGDKILMTVGIIFGFLHGCKWILLPWIIGSFVDVLSVVSMHNNYSHILILEADASAPRSALDGFHTYTNFQQTYGLNASVATTVTHEIYKVVPTYVVLLAISIACYFGMNIALQRAASNQVQRIKMAFVNSLLQQDINWFDNSKPSRLISQTEIDFNIYQDCIGLKLGILFSYLSLFVAGFFYSVILQWKVALIGYSSSLLGILMYKVSTMVQQRYSAKEMKSYSEAGIVAEDVLTAFKTVIGYNGQANETQRYTDILIKGRRAGIVKSVLKATLQALVSLFFLGTLTLMSWFATNLYSTIESDSSQNSTTHLVTVFMVIVISYQLLGESIGLANYIFLAKSSGQRLLGIINKEPSYDCITNSNNKQQINAIDKIEFKNVEFHYSSRKDMKVLCNFNLQINKGEKVALVGNSGSGKSTVVSLLHRFYDPTKGSIRINGYDIKELNLGWLRTQIGVVSQEPVLFPTTIYENIRYGDSKASMEDIEMAAKMANAHNFIMDLPLKYETNVGDRGTQLSGGQKQRIAIARALIRKPPILLLDEATSALDSQSELIVQQALDNASVGRTSIIIAHRLSTIRNADKIVVVSNGEIVEIGNHDSLMNIKGAYYRLVKIQECSNDRDITPNVISNSNKIITEEIVQDDSKKTKLDILKNKLVERIEFPPNSMKNSRMGLSYIRSMPVFRLLTIGGSGPIFMCLGILASIGQGLGVLLLYIYVFPAWFEIFGSHNPIVASSRLNALLFSVLVCAIVLVISTFLMILFLELAGALIAKQLRSKLFNSLMRQQVSWYDQSKASVGNLCLTLSQDTENVKMTLSTHLGLVVTAITQTVSGLITIFLMSWIYGCISLIFYIMALAFPIYSKQKAHKEFLKKAELSKFSNEMLREVVMNIRTIRFLGAEDEFRKLYMQDFSSTHNKKNICSYHIPFLEAIVDSNSQLANFCNLLITPTLFLCNDIMFIQFFRIWGAGILATIIGRALCVVPNVSTALVSLEKIFSIIDEKCKTEDVSGEGKILVTEQPGTLLLDDVSFSYPTRSKSTALNRFHIDIRSHQKVAIVGSSGSGKSTCIQLAARFYDPQNGQVYVCNELVREVQLHSLRQAMAIVEQEPMMFNRSIADNIAYGDISRVISMEEIVETARIAHAHDFISKLPQGYETIVGNRGTQISGGQKQRIAIARALIRKPKLLFLDEATSALDSETDKEVQMALRSCQNASTMVIIAHRLSTITDADQIIVVHRGTVVEKGRHNELMDLNGFYADLYQNQVNNEM